MGHDLRAIRDPKDQSIAAGTPDATSVAHLLACLQEALRSADPDLISAAAQELATTSEHHAAALARAANVIQTILEPARSHEPPASAETCADQPGTKPALLRSVCAGNAGQEEAAVLGKSQTARAPSIPAQLEASWLSHILYDGCKLAARLLVCTAFRCRFYGRENVPRKGGVLLLSNHQSYLDPMLVSCSLRRRCCFMATDTLFRNPLLGATLRMLGAFQVRLGTASNVRLGIQKLATGSVLLVFPEGTRTYDGHLLPFRRGFRFLAARSRVPIVPLAIEGAFHAWPRTRFLPRPWPVRVMFGRSIPTEELEQASDAKAATLVSEEITSMLERLRCLPSWPAGTQPNFNE